MVMPRLVLSLLPDSIRLSSNIRILPAQTLRTLRHRLLHVCSQTRLASYTAIRRTQTIESQAQYCNTVAHRHAN